MPTIETIDMRDNRPESYKFGEDEFSGNLSKKLCEEIALTLENKKQMYVMYDDFGKITLKSLEDMKTNILIDKDTAISYDYSSTIDSNTYNKVKLVFDNDKTKKRDVYIAQSSKNMNKWGVLQLYETLQEGENGKAKADALLKLYN